MALVAAFALGTVQVGNAATRAQHDPPDPWGFPIGVAAVLGLGAVFLSRDLAR